MAPDTAPDGDQDRVTDSAAHPFTPKVDVPSVCSVCDHTLGTDVHQTATAASEDDAVTDTLHIRLVCWDHKHVQVISAEALHQIVIAPICTAPTDNGICGSPIWAVEHEGEPMRYVGRPPHQGWASWADCVGAT